MGMEFHGFPAEIQEHQCDPGIQNCVKIFGTKPNATKLDYGWGCGTKQSRDGCVNGLPNGITFDTGETYSSIMTCFCHAGHHFFQHFLSVDLKLHCQIEICKCQLYV